MSGKIDWEKLIIDNKPVKCELCGGKMFYMGIGEYKCNSCGHMMLDDFGKVREFLEENGAAPALAVAEATGVNPEIIEKFLEKGKVEIPEGSPYYFKCERCSCSIRYGRYCPECVKELAGDIHAVFNEEAEEKARAESNPKQIGKMRFLNRK